MRRFAVGSREVDLDRAEVRGPEGATALTPNEVKVLGVLAANAGRVVERDVLLCEALGYRQAVNTRAIDQAVWRLRRKLEAEPHEPRWLLSEANVGYRLELDPAPARTLLGRADDVARLLAALDEAAGSGRRVVVVGLPGSGRRSIVAAAAGTRGGPVPVDVEDRFPDDPTAVVLRVGPLPPEAARALLVREVLALRGSATLSEEEDLEVADAAARAGHHPATLRRMAQAAVLTRLGRVRAEPIQAIVDHVAALPDEIRDVLRRCAPFPDAFLAEEVGAPASALAAAWRACVLDSVPGEGGERRLVVPPCVRAAAPPGGDHEASRAFVARVIAAAVPAALGVIRRHAAAARLEILRDRGRVDAAWDLATPAQRRELLPALLARWIVSDALPEPVPAHDPDETPDQAVCVDLLQAFAAERTDRRAGLPHVDRATGRADASLDYRVYAWVVAASRAVWALRPGEHLRAMEAIRELAEAHADVPTILATFHHSRAVERIRSGDDAGAREDLLRAMALFGPDTTVHNTIMYNLASEAARDGRVGEALAWAERVDPSLSPPHEEARKRLQRATLYQLADRLEDAERELSLAELLQERSWALAIGWATQALLEGRPAEAAVRAEAAQIDRPRLGDAGIALPMVLGWARVAQGVGDRALAVIDACPAPLLTHVDYAPQLELLRAAALSRSSLPDGVARAHERLAALDAAPLRYRWWAPTRRIVAALVEGAAEEARRIADEMARGGIGHLVARFAGVAVAQGADRFRTADADNRPAEAAVARERRR